MNDIYVEVEKQLASLKRQASKARRYAEMREQMRGLLRQILAGKTGELRRRSRAAFATWSAKSPRRKPSRPRQPDQLEAEQARLDRRTEELDAELRQNQNLIGMAALELDRAENRIVFNRQRTEELRLRGEQLAVEAGQLAAQSTQVESRVREQDEVVAGLRAEATRLESLLLALGNRAAELASATETRKPNPPACAARLPKSQETAGAAAGNRARNGQFPGAQRRRSAAPGTIRAAIARRNPLSTASAPTPPKSAGRTPPAGRAASENPCKPCSSAWPS